MVEGSKIKYKKNEYFTEYEQEEEYDYLVRDKINKLEKEISNEEKNKK